MAMPEDSFQRSRRATSSWTVVQEPEIPGGFASELLRDAL